MKKTSAQERTDPNSSFFAPPLIGNRTLLAIVSVVVVTLIVDTNLGYVSDFVHDSLVSSSGIAAFVGIAAIFSVGQYFILGFVRRRNRQSATKTLQLSLANIAVQIAQVALVAAIVTVVLEILITSQYNSSLLAASTSVSYLLLIAIFALLTRGFVSWYKSSPIKKDILILALTGAMAAYVVFAACGLILFLAMLQQQPAVITAEHIAQFPEFEPGTFVGEITTWYQVAGGITFFAIWLGVVMLLRPYTKRFGKIKFWALMGGVLLYHSIQIPLFMFGWLVPPEGMDEVTSIFLFSVVDILSGVIFAAAFLSVARSLPKGSILRHYMTIAAYGLLLLSVATPATASNGAYPPFGLATVSFVGLSSFLVYVGLYSSAISVSQDLALRQSIKKTIKDQSRFLDSIGTAQMENELQNRVLKVAKNNSEALAEQTGVQPSMTEDDMKDYMDIVIGELKNKQ